jgi:hypothetical protein
MEAQVSATTIGVGEQATYSLTIENAQDGQLDLPNFGQLNAQGPSKSQQMSTVLGSGGMTVTSSVVYSWVIDAPAEGQYTIGPAKLTTGGRTISSNSVQITCSGTAPQRPPPQQQRSPFGFPDDDPFQSLFQQQQPHGDSDVFVRATLDKSEAYIGEQVTLSLFVYSRLQVQLQDISLPKLDGFWSEDLEKQGQHRVEVVRGVRYDVTLIRRTALFPIRAGDLSVDSVGVDMVAAVSFFSQQQLKRKSEPLKLKVKPLPTGRTADYEATNVGAYSLNVVAPSQPVPLGQPVQIKVVLDGTGNIKSAKVPKPQFPEGLKSFDPTITDKVRIQADRYGGTKTIEWVVVPERTGDLTIPGLEMPVFDPAQGTYVTAKTRPIELHVIPGEGPAPVAHNGEVVPAVPNNVLSAGIRPIRMLADATAPAPPLWKRFYFWPLAGVPVLAWTVVWGGGLFIGALRRRDPNRLKEKKARSVATRRLRAARDRLEARDANGFYLEVTRALQEFVTDKTRVAVLGLTREELGRVLVDRGYQAVRVGALVRLLESCETARFSPLASSTEEMTRLLDEAGRVLDDLEAGAATARVA